MWIITRTGFVSLVEHMDDATMVRARARRRQHLADTFPTLSEDDIIDLGPSAPDYRYHANVNRTDAAETMMRAVMDIDYTSHVKEEISGDDDKMYYAMLDCWHALYGLQSKI